MWLSICFFVSTVDETMNTVATDFKRKENQICVTEFDETFQIFPRLHFWRKVVVFYHIRRFGIPFIVLKIP